MWTVFRDVPRPFFKNTIKSCRARTMRVLSRNYSLRASSGHNGFIESCARAFLTRQRMNRPNHCQRWGGRWQVDVPVITKKDCMNPCHRLAQNTGKLKWAEKLTIFTKGKHWNCGCQWYIYCFPAFYSHKKLKNCQCRHSLCMTVASKKTCVWPVQRIIYSLDIFCVSCLNIICWQRIYPYDIDWPWMAMANMNILPSWYDRSNFTKRRGCRTRGRHDHDLSTLSVSRHISVETLYDVKCISGASDRRDWTMNTLDSRRIRQTTSLTP